MTDVEHKEQAALIDGGYQRQINRQAKLINQLTSQIDQQARTIQEQRDAFPRWAWKLANYSANLRKRLRR